MRDDEVWKRRRCDRCKFWAPAVLGDAPDGWCKRFPPVIRHPRWEHPATSADDWCGEFQEDPEK